MSRLLTRIYDAALRPLGIQSSQFSVLIAVAMFGERGAQLGPLADRLVMDRTTLTRNIRPIEKAGLVRVSRLPEDARARVVTLTKAGERKIEAAYPLWERAQSSARKKFGAERIETFRTHVSELIEHVSVEEGAAR
jgi:DNA-binding MarR family transcriptional regulator